MDVACALIPRFALRAAAGSGWRPERAAALAPASDSGLLGEVSASAEAQGLEAGMALAEALGRCPELQLVAADPARASELWEAMLARLEGIGAALESERDGEAFFALAGLRALHGGTNADVFAAARAACGPALRLAAAPTRFAAALAAAPGPGLRPPPTGGEREAIVSVSALAGFLGPHPVAALRGRLGGDAAEEQLLGALGRLGIETLAQLAALSADQLADRFGRLGLRALRLARGADTPLRPRAPREELVAEIELPDGTAGEQLGRALALLVERLLADPGRRRRTILALRLSAPLCAGGSWSVEQGLGRPTAAPRTIAPLLAARLEGLPGPADALRLQVLAFGPQSPDQLELALAGPQARQRRLAAAVREVRTAAGAEALLGLVDLEPRSRVPERRFLLSRRSPR